MSIRAVTSHLSATVASPAISLGFAALTYLFPKAFATPIAVEIPVPVKSVAKNSVPTPEKSIFTDSQRSWYFKYSTVNSLPRSEKEDALHQLKQTDFSDEYAFANEKASLAIDAAQDYQEQAKTTSLLDQPLFFQQATSALQDIEPIDHTLREQVRKMQKELSIAEARACQKAAQSQISNADRLSYLFAGITALGLNDAGLSRNLPIYPSDHLISEWLQLGAKLWEEAGQILESLDPNTPLDYEAFSYKVTSDRIDDPIVSPHHAAARCYLNGAKTITLQEFIFSQSEDANNRTKRAERKNFNFLDKSIRLFKSVDLSDFRFTHEQRAWLRGELVNACSFRLFTAESLPSSSLQKTAFKHETHVQAVKAAQDFAKAAAEAKYPFHNQVQSVRFFTIAGDTAPTKEKAIFYYRQAIDIAEKLPAHSLATMSEDERPIVNTDKLIHKIDSLKQQKEKETPSSRPMFDRFITVAGNL